VHEIRGVKRRPTKKGKDAPAPKPISGSARAEGLRTLGLGGFIPTFFETWTAVVHARKE
jgi:hypothetical protein